VEQGTPFGRYRLLELLGQGGMGEVWRAHDTTIDRVVAIKMLLPHYAEDPDYETRFRREARAAARLDDPHVVPIYDVGEIDGRLYVAMQLINGVDLQTMLSAGPLEPRRAVQIVEQIASALHAAHQAGLVHRDVKPSNILVTPKDFAYLIDFGIARAADDSPLTKANTTMGTWAYMAPERFRSGDADPSGDVYALACVLYQCLTGHPPFPGDDLEQVAVGHMVTPPPHPSEELDTVPTALDQVITTGLAKQPTDRYPNTLEMAAAARQAITDPIPRGSHIAPYAEPTRPWPATLAASPNRSGAAPAAWRRPGVLIGALAAVALLVAGGVFAAVKFSQRENAHAPTSSSTTPAASTPTKAPNTGPFTGIYQVDFGRVTRLDGVANPSATPSTGTYGVRSECHPGGCVATAAKWSGDASFASSVVFDQLGDSWVSVTVAPGQCNGRATETWQVFTLRPRPDGSLAGQHIRLTPDSCAEKQDVTFTRTGDVDVDADLNGLPDPAALPARVVSPADGLRGRYGITRVFSGRVPLSLGESTVTTHCLRAGDRCMSYFPTLGGDIPLVFADGNWVWTNDNEGPCPGGPPSQLMARGVVPLPQPLQNPIPVLTGHGTWVQTGGCAATTTFDETYTRVGD